MTAFSINQSAEIHAVSITRGKAEGAPVFITIGLVFNEVTLDPVATALGCEPLDLLALFDPDGDPVFTGVENVETWATYEHKHSIRMLHHSHQVKKISKIKIRPRGNRRFTVSCNVLIENPTDHFVERVAGCLHELVGVDLVHQAVLDFGDATEKAQRESRGDLELGEEAA